MPNAVVAIDSVSALCSEKLMTDGIGTSDYGSGNRLIAQFCDILAPVVTINNTILIGIIHFYANTSGYGAAKVEKAASRWKYQADVALQCKGFKPWILGDKETGKQIGQEVEWLVKTSALGPPGAKMTSFIQYGVGVDKVYEIMKVAEEFGLVDVSGAWTTFCYLANHQDLLAGTQWEGKEKVQFQGGQKAYEALANQAGFYEALLLDMRERVGL